MQFTALKTPLFHAGEDLFAFFCAALEESGLSLPEKSVVIIASKVVALAQNRVVEGSKETIEQWVEKEAERYWPTHYPHILLSIKNDILIANAGIDASNSENGKLILWPENPQKYADEFCVQLRGKFSLQNIGAIIADSRCTPMRSGVSGVALAWSGFLGVRSEEGKLDLFGKPLLVTKNAVADNLASAAELIMGNAGESTPFIVCTQAPVDFTADQQSPKTAVFSPEEDIFAPIMNLF